MHAVAKRQRLATVAAAAGRSSRTPTAAAAGRRSKSRTPAGAGQRSKSAAAAAGSDDDDDYNPAGGTNMLKWSHQFIIAVLCRLSWLANSAAVDILLPGHKPVADSVVPIRMGHVRVVTATRSDCLQGISALSHGRVEPQAPFCDVPQHLHPHYDVLVKS